MSLGAFLSRRRLMLAGGVVMVAVIAVAGRAYLRGNAPPTGEAVEVTRGNFTDIVEIRGQVAPVRTTYVTAPSNAGELQILKIARSGAAVAAGEVVAEFDAVTLRRTIQEKQSELRSATAELDQGQAQTAITLEEREAAIHKARFEVEKAKLSVGEVALVSEIEAERARLALADAEQRLRESEAGAASARANAQADRETRERRIEKVRAELALAERQAKALFVQAPTSGTVNIQPNYRAATPGAPAPEFRAGDRAFPGATILDLPDLSSVYLTARLDEADRGRLAVGQTAVIRIDAIADRDYQAAVSQVSVLARIDFTSWPPPKQFDLTMAIKDADERLRPGMTAAARIAVGTLPDVLLVPASTTFYEAGRTVVYRWSGRAFEPRAVTVLRRGRGAQAQAAISGEIEAGDLIARTQPGTEEGQP